MVDVKRINKRDLIKLNQFINVSSELLRRVGLLEAEKTALLMQHNQVQVEQKRFIDDLKNDYKLTEGEFEIDSTTGEIKKAK